jgi:hypothetical protein
MARLIIPPRLLAIDIVGTVLAAVGLAGLFTDVSSILPFMVDRNVAGMIAAIGFALMTFAVIKILQYLRALRSQPPDTQ